MTEHTYDALVVSAHPDDAEMAMGGTLIKLAQTGKRILHLCLTRGECGTFGSAETREQEFINASRILGCDFKLLDFQDTQVENTSETRLEVAKLIRETKPQVIFAPYHTNNLAEFGGIAHTDHLTTGALIRDAAKLARLKGLPLGLPAHEVAMIYFYMLPRNVLPTVVVDVSDVLEQTFTLIQAYQSQMAINFKGVAIEDLLKSMRQAVGFSFGLQYAEAFVTDIPLNFSGNSFFNF